MGKYMIRKNLVFASACMGMLLFGIVFLSLGTVSTFIQEKFGLDKLAVASLASSLPLGMLMGSLLFGPMVDRFGYKPLMLISTGFILLALEMIAFSGSVWMFRVSYFLIGLGGGAINGGTNALVADLASESKGAKLSLLGVFFGIGALGMPLITGSLIHVMPYNTIIGLIGGIVLVPLLFIVFVRFPEPKYQQGFPVHQALALLKEPILLVMGFILFFESALEGITGNWTTSYLKGISLSDQAAIFALSAEVITIGTTRLLLSRLLRTVRPRIILYTCFFLLITGSVTLYLANSFAGAVAAMIIIGAGSAAGFPVILGYVGELFADLSGTAFGIAMVIALVGNTLVNYLVGWISASSGIRHFPFILLFCAMMMLVLFSMVLKMVSHKIKT